MMKCLSRFLNGSWDKRMKEAEEREKKRQAEMNEWWELYGEREKMMNGYISDWRWK